MTVPFKIALIAFVAATALYILARVFDQFSSPFPRVTNWADNAVGVCGILIFVCLIVAFPALIYGIAVS